MRHFAAILVLACALPAQMTKVIPAKAAQVDGNTGSVWPFAYSTARCQQLIDGAVVCSSSSIITGLAYRRDGAATGTLQAQLLPSLKLRLSHTSVTPGSMSSTFSQNITGTETVAFNGAYNLPAQVAASPAPFNIAWTWPAPFVYIRGNGNLLIDFEITGTLGKNSYTTDAENQATGIGTAAVFGVKGAFSGQDPYTFGCSDAAKLVPGGQAGLTASGLLQGYPALAAYGTSNTSFAGLPLPLDLGPLGAPGNSIHAAIAFMLPLTLVQGGGAWSGSVAVPVPADPWLAGVVVYGQAWFVHAASNALGLVTSNGAAMAIGPAGPPMRLVGNYDPASPTGTVSSTPTGQVVQLTGVFN